MTSRYQALKILLNVTTRQASLTDALSDIKKTDNAAFIQALCYGVCRWYYKLDAIARQLVSKPLKKKDQDIYLLILMGLYQLTEMRLPDYAAVSETVAVADKLKKSWAKSLINAVLRNFQRGNHSFDENDLAARYAHPEWMIKKIQEDWPEQWRSILDANNEHPPLSLRVNQKKITREDYLKKLASADITAFVIPETEMGISLENPMDVKDLPGFISGEVSVQDGAAQLAASFLQIKSGQRILDACAAPGGKTSHILEMATGPVEVIALDRDENRLKSVHENLKRLSLEAQCIRSDAGDVNSWWDGKLFDRILLDAPCSALGVIRRHPDIKLLRQASDIAVLAKEQLRLLSALWPLLKPGGLFVYATCSILHDENSAVIKKFLLMQNDAKEEKKLQILPGMQGMDGFFYSCLRKCIYGTEPCA